MLRNDPRPTVKSNLFIDVSRSPRRYGVSLISGLTGRGYSGLLLR